MTTKESSKFPTTDTELASYLRHKNYRLIEVRPDFKQCVMIFDKSDEKTFESDLQDFVNRQNDAAICRNILRCYKELLQDINLTKEHSRSRK